MKTIVSKKYMFLLLALVLAVTLLVQVQPALAGISTTPSGPVCRYCTSVELVVTDQALFEPLTFTLAGFRLPWIGWTLWR